MPDRPAPIFKMPEPGQLVGKITLFLRFPADLSMQTDIQDPKIVVGMLRQVADAMDRATNVPHADLVIQGREAIPAAALKE